MTFFKKLIAILTGAEAQLRIISAKIYDRLGGDIFEVSDDERRERIVAYVKSYLAVKYPQFAAYEGIVVDFVVERVREALRKR